jgi:predicted transcriptional regulator
VMTIVWDEGEISVRDACQRLGSAVAYTTVMTTMDRLFKKRLLARQKVGRAFVYRAAASRDELEGAVATELVQSLLQRNRDEPLPILSSLVDAVSDRDRALLDELERLIHEKRRAADTRKPDE